MISRTAELKDGAEIMIRIPQDPGQAGKDQARSIISEMAGYPIRKELQSGSKEARAEPLAAQVEVGNVVMVEGPWNRALIEEMRTFPLGQYKDQVDACATAFNAVCRSGPEQAPLRIVGERAEAVRI